jgi:hypothetical protein
MKVTHILAISTATILGLAPMAHAESTSTRAQVLAEAAEAQRTGDVVDYEMGRKLNELNPSAYPRVVKLPTLPSAPTSAGTTKPGTSTTSAANLIGDLEYDAIAERSAQAIARRDATSQSYQVTGLKR